MTKPASTIKKIRKQDSPECRLESLNLADNIGIAAACKLILHESRLYSWHSKQQQPSSSDRELTAENARLKHQSAKRDEDRVILQKATA